MRAGWLLLFTGEIFFWLGGQDRRRRGDIPLSELVTEERKVAWGEEKSRKLENRKRDCERKRFLGLRESKTSKEV